MTTLYTEAAADALEAIREAGQTIPLKRFGGIFDPIEGGTSERGVLNAELSALALSLSKTDIAKLDSRLTTALHQGKVRKLLAAALGVAFEPLANDVVLFEGRYWHVRGVSSLNPAGTAVLYYIIVERGSISEADQAALPVTELALVAEELSTLINETFPA